MLIGQAAKNGQGDTAKDKGKGKAPEPPPNLDNLDPAEPHVGGQTTYKGKGKSKENAPRPAPNHDNLDPVEPQAGMLKQWGTFSDNARFDDELRMQQAHRARMARAAEEEAARRASGAATPPMFITKWKSRKQDEGEDTPKGDKQEVTTFKEDDHLKVVQITQFISVLLRTNVRAPQGVEPLTMTEDADDSNRAYLVQIQMTPLAQVALDIVMRSPEIRQDPESMISFLELLDEKTAQRQAKTAAKGTCAIVPQGSAVVPRESAVVPEEPPVVLRESAVVPGESPMAPPLLYSTVVRDGQLESATAVPSMTTPPQLASKKAVMVPSKVQPPLVDRKAPIVPATQPQLVMITGILEVRHDGLKYEAITRKTVEVTVEVPVGVEVTKVVIIKMNVDVNVEVVEAAIIVVIVGVGAKAVEAVTYIVIVCVDLEAAEALTSMVSVGDMRRNKNQAIPVVTRETGHTYLNPVKLVH
ncbi:hypothetical protein MMC17_003005 [Xylographa soralifera]|nr:hypothetical protein [Xylographa soralifera]